MSVGQTLDPDALMTLNPSWRVSRRVYACCTTRSGGVSLPPYNDLNLGLHVGDDEDHVKENRTRVENKLALPQQPNWLRQTHSARVHAFQASNRPTSETDTYHGSDRKAVAQCANEIEADGAWTDQSNIVLAVLTADCLPIVISEENGAAIAAVHAGWRGLSAGIVQNALALFDHNHALHAWLGPAIGPDAFEVGEDVRQAFVERQSSYCNAFKPGNAAGKYWCDLYALARAELRQSRSITVTGGEYCTHHQSTLFHSHRRDGVKSGRMATFVWVSPET